MRYEIDKPEHGQWACCLTPVLGFSKMNSNEFNIHLGWLAWCLTITF